MVGTALSRRQVGTQLAPLGAGLLRRRLLAVEQGVGALLLGRLGCQQCARWPANAVIDRTADQDSLRGDTVAWGLPKEWPESLRCDACGRTPQNVIVLRYAEEWPPQRGPRTVPLLPTWRVGDTS